MKWVSSPARSGLYWAHKGGRTSICEVVVFKDFRWQAKFLKGGTYNFSENGSWRWQPIQAPPAPEVPK